MKNKNKEFWTAKDILHAVFILIILNIVMTCIADEIKHPQLTQTQVFFRIPQTFFWNFKL